MPQLAVDPRSLDDRAGRVAGPPPRWRGPALTRHAGRLVAALLLLAAGCASAPVVRWHSLLATGDAVPAPVGNAGSAAATGAAASSWWVELTVLRVPVETQQPQWLVRLPDDTLRLLEEERWAAPLRDELRAALMQGLVARWNAVDARSNRPSEPTTDAIRDTLPQPGSPTPAGAAVAAPSMQANRPATPTAADAAAPMPTPELRRVTVDVSRFDSLPDREARLDAVWTIAAVAAVAAAPAPLLSCRSAFREPVGSGAPALAAGHRRAVAELADAIGRALQAGRGAACPGVGSPPR